MRRRGHERGIHAEVHGGNLFTLLPFRKERRKGFGLLPPVNLRFQSGTDGAFSRCLSHQTGHLSTGTDGGQQGQDRNILDTMG
jgi:cytosine/adenosine deaminase-related metal-dependent hydrolase